MDFLLRTTVLEHHYSAESGPLYAIIPSSPSDSPHALLSSTYASIRHQRLGYPGDSVLRF